MFATLFGDLAPKPQFRISASGCVADISGRGVPLMTLTGPQKN